MSVELVFTCPTCLTDWPEPACGGCGKSLMPTLRAVPDPPPSPYRELMTALARDTFERKP